MDLPNQVTNKDISKDLKKLGVRQESFWYWSKEAGDKLQSRKSVGDGRTTAYSAFSASELGEFLPETIKGYPLVIRKEMDGWNVSYEGMVKEYTGCGFWEKTLADAMGMLLCFFIKQGRILLKEPEGDDR